VDDGLTPKLRWRVARVVDSTPETESAQTIGLTVPGWGGHLAGQHIDLKLTAEDGYSAQRSYSLSRPADGERIELTVQQIADGEVSPLSHAIVAAAVVSGNIGVAVGSILGGIAIQTVVLVALDAFGVRGSRPLTYRAGVAGAGAGGRAGRRSAGHCDRRHPAARNAVHSAADARPGADPDGVGAGPGVVATGGTVVALARVGPAPRTASSSPADIAPR
jgi:hypothetical protein